MGTSTTVNSASLFPCLDYTDNFQRFSRGSLKRTDKCLIKQTEIEKKLKTGLKPAFRLDVGLLPRKFQFLFQHLQESYYKS